MIKRLISRFLFGDQKAQKPKDVISEKPKAGDVWMRCISDGSPWPKKEIYEVEVLDVNSGWVRYYMSEFFPDERMKVDIFTMIYIKKN